MADPDLLASAFPALDDGLTAARAKCDAAWAKTFRDGETLSQVGGRDLQFFVRASGEVEILCRDTTVRRTNGDGHPGSVGLFDAKAGRGRAIETPAVFSFIGATPRTWWLPEEVVTDARGFVKTGPTLAGSPSWTAPARRSRSKRAGPACSRRATCAPGRPSGSPRRSGRGRRPASSSTSTSR